MELNQVTADFVVALLLAMLVAVAVVVCLVLHSATWRTLCPLFPASERERERESIYE